MVNLDEIKSAIEALPKNDLIHLKQWFSENDWEEWDLQIENDSVLGKLDFLVEEAGSEKKTRQPEGVLMHRTTDRFRKCHQSRDC